jgi:hypothetical protein
MLAIESLDDFGSQDRFELFGIGILVPQVPEDVTAASREFEFLVIHRSVPFNHVVRYDNNCQGDAYAACGAVSSLDPSVRKLSSVEQIAEPAITIAMGSAGLSMKPRNVVVTAAIRN